MRGKYKKVPVDVDEVVIDSEASKKMRVSSYLRQVKNPYLLKIDGVVVEMEYAENGPTLDEAAGQMAELGSGLIG